MRHITNCPSCQTQFFVTDEQLNQHGGKVRCGQCLHVFNAKEQIIEAVADPAVQEVDFPVEPIPPSPQAEVEASAVNLPADSPPADSLSTDTPAAAVSDTATNPETPSKQDSGPVVPDAEDTFTIDYQPSYLDDFLDRTKLLKPRTKANKWLWIPLILLLLLAALAQAAYFLRNDIAIYYPASKPYLIQACQLLQCKVELPKRIEFIVIDDSDIQEDADHNGLIWLSSTLINQADFQQAFPNLELTLTDVEDQPKLRRLFKPAEYLPHGTDIAAGLAPRQELRLKLGITTDGVPVVGYRVLVTY